VSSTWSSIREAFTESTALELDLLGRALPLSPLAATGDVRIRVDGGHTHIGVAAAPLRVHVSLALADRVGATAEGCVELLGIRPLLFGTAWKVLDLFMDAVMADNNEPTNRLGRYPIAAKVQRANSGQLAQNVLEQDTWDALRHVYTATDELRHSLIHRRVTVDNQGTLTGHDEQGASLTPTLTVEEQEALARAAQRLGEAAGQSPPVDARIQLDLAAWLTRLSGLHGVTLRAGEPLAVIRELTYVVDPDPESGTYPLPVPELWELPNLEGQNAVDLVVEFRDQPGVIARGRLEEAPTELVQLSPTALPDWLRR
jgi:hypothetical protein